MALFWTHPIPLTAVLWWAEKVTAGAAHTTEFFFFRRSTTEEACVCDTCTNDR